MVSYKQLVGKDVTVLNAYLMIGLAFFLPLSVAGVNLMLYTMLLLFAVERNYKERFSGIKSNPLVYLILGIVGMHLLGVAWSDNLSMAAETLKRIYKFLWIPFLMMYIKREHIIYYFQAFILGMMISETLTYLVWLDIVAPFKYATEEMPAPLMHHTAYTLFVAMASTLLVYFLWYKKHKTMWQKIIASFFLATMLLNLFISGGRAGQVGFFILIFVLIICHYREQLLKGLIAFSVLSVTLIVFAYQTIPLFKDRADKGIYEVTHFAPGMQVTSLGTRMALNKNYFEIFSEHPWFGVGTGDYLDEYKQINAKSDYRTMETHPHNMYLLLLVQFGIVGGVLLLLLFGYQFYLGITSQDDLRVFRIGFPLFFLVLVSVNWYLYQVVPMMLFVFFSAVLYHRYDKPVALYE